MNSIHQLISPVLESEKFISYGLVKESPFETVVAGSSITETFAPVRMVSEPIYVLLLFLESKSN